MIVVIVVACLLSPSVKLPGDFVVSGDKLFNNSRRALIAEHYRYWGSSERHWWSSRARPELQTSSRFLHSQIRLIQTGFFSRAFRTIAILKKCLFCCVTRSLYLELHLSLPRATPTEHSLDQTTTTLYKSC
ncbi:hypothetical protein RRG08_032573 [Elysia crispata]|uniref:Secreted protein n=1 Tax=Elysia crispata TaxID=231223 RepID=A0AAE0ZXP2_9GAST|nr:hypothetical protein RRG08_032573 [Elysia crispata]